MVGIGVGDAVGTAEHVIVSPAMSNGSSFLLVRVVGPEHSEVDLKTAMSATLSLTHLAILAASSPDAIHVPDTIFSVPCNDLTVTT